MYCNAFSKYWSYWFSEAVIKVITVKRDTEDVMHPPEATRSVFASIGVVEVLRFKDSFRGRLFQSSVNVDLRFLLLSGETAQQNNTFWESQ